MPKILIFEDDKMMGGMYATKFSMAGFEVAFYEHPEADPIPTVLREKPDIISTGIIMPVMDGFSLARLIKADPRTKDIPIIGLDNLNMPDDLAKAREVGMTDYVISAKHMPGDVVERVCEILHLPKPTFNHLETVQTATPPKKEKPWWKLF